MEQMVQQRFHPDHVERAEIKRDDLTLFDEPAPQASLAQSAAITQREADQSPEMRRLNDQGFEVLFPKFPLTGQERSLADLTQPDERSIGYRLEVETLQAPYLAIENRLPATTPPTLSERIVLARNLVVYGFFCHEFYAVSLFWSDSCIEMALKLKLKNPGPFELQRKVDNKEENCSVTLTDLEDKLRIKWRIDDLPFFDYSFKALLIWAFRKSMLSDDIEIPIQEIVNSYNNRFALKVFPAQAQNDGLLCENPTLEDIEACWNGLSDDQRKHYRLRSSTVVIEELPRFRNMMAHPKHFNLVTPPGSPLSAFNR